MTHLEEIEGRLKLYKETFGDREGEFMDDEVGKAIQAIGFWRKYSVSDLEWAVDRIRELEAENALLEADSVVLQADNAGLQAEKEFYALRAGKEG